MNSETCEKWKQRIIKDGISLGVFILMVFLVVMIINFIMNYLFACVDSIGATYRHTHTFSVQLQPFVPAYLVTTPQGMSGLIIFALAFAFMTVMGRKTAVRISQRITALIPTAAPSIEGSSRWATDREIKEQLTPVPKVKILKNLPRGRFRRICDRLPAIKVMQERISFIGYRVKHCMAVTVVSKFYKKLKNTVDDDKTVQVTGGILLAEDKENYYVDTDTVNTFVIGTTRSGKDQLIVLSTIYLISQVDNPQSFVAFDLKGDMLENSYVALKAKGYVIYVFNLDTPERSNHKNLLSNIIKTYKKDLQEGDTDFPHAIELIHELAFTITENSNSDPVWPGCAKSLLSAMMIYLLDECGKKDMLDKYTLPSVYNFFVELGSCDRVVNKKKINALDDLFSALPAGHPAKMDYASSKFADGEMRSSVFSTLAQNLEIFGDPGVARLISGDDINFGNLADCEKPCAIFLIIPDGKKTKYKLASLFITQCYDELLEISRNCPARVLPQRVRFILNELGNMPKIPDLVTKITSALGRNILFDLYVQSMEQLDKYGQSDASTIQGNCGNWVYINSLDPKTNKYVSEQLGPGTTEYKTYNSDNGDMLDRSRMSHYKGRPLKMPDELPRMKFGEIIIIRQRCYPIHAKLTPFYKLKLPVRQISEIIEKEPPVSLQSLLYPVEINLNMTSDYSAMTGALDKKAAEEAEKEKVKLKGALNSINLLTMWKFNQSVKKGDFTAAQKMVDKYLSLEKISAEYAEILETLISEQTDLTEAIGEGE
jgi:type IV secretory pathway TraG/TraD family ATPase VirD4